MTIRAIMGSIARQDDLNFLLTNGIPRRLATRLMGWFSRIESPLICHASLWVWKLFTELDLSDAADTRFRSLHDCFTRRLQAGARPITTDPGTLVSPCDAIIGAMGNITGNEILQVKGSSYSLADLVADSAHALQFASGCYVTLRLTSAMYHHFHAPYDCTITAVRHIPGDTWNVNPPTLRRIPRLFCRNERAVIRTVLLGTGHAITLVPVAAILVAGIRLRFLDRPLGRDGSASSAFTCAVHCSKGEEIGWFEHGSTIIVLAPAGFRLCDGLVEGSTIRVGQPLMRLPAQR